MKIKYIIAILMSGSVLSGYSQEVFDLQELIDRVLIESYQVRIVRNEAVQAANDNTLGNAGFLPVISLQGGESSGKFNTRQELFNGDLREGNNARNNTISGLVEADWTIFDGFKMFARKDKLALLQQMGELNARYYLEQTIADVSVAYYQLVKENQILENLLAASKVSAFRYHLEVKRQKVGAGDALQINQAMMDYCSDSMLVIEQKQVVKSISIQINRMINRELDLPVFIEDQSMTPGSVFPKDSLIQMAINASKDIQQARIQELIAETDVKIQKAERYPQLDVYGRYSYSRQTNEIGITHSNRSYGQLFGLTVRFNLFNGGNVNRAIVNQELASENTTLTRQDVTQQINKTVLDAYYKYQSLEAQLSVAMDNVKRAQSSEEIARAQLEKGIINGYDFRQTQLSVIRANNVMINLRFEQMSLGVELRRLTGRLEEIL